MIRRRIILFFVILALTCGCLQEASAENTVWFDIPDGVQIIRDIEYAVVDGISLKLDLYLPEDEQSRPPLVIYIHGGAWLYGSKEDCKIKWLPDHGYAVASIEYRFSWQETFPAQIYDCKGAVRWLRAHARVYGYKAKRIGVAGDSAGGHLAALLGTSGGKRKLEGDVGGYKKKPSRVQAVLDMYGPTDFIIWAKKVGPIFDTPLNPVYLLLGGPVSENRSLARQASPARHINEGDPPILILHGDLDLVVPVSQSKLLNRKYKKAGLASTLHIIKGAGHGGSEFQDETRRELIVAFFDEHLKN
jgi:acetyl esterase/lipase